MSPPDAYSNTHAGQRLSLRSHSIALEVDSLGQSWEGQATFQVLLCHASPPHPINLKARSSFHKLDYSGLNSLVSHKIIQFFRDLPVSVKELDLLLKGGL